jgi:hypothetical protein
VCVRERGLRVARTSRAAVPGPLRRSRREREGGGGGGSGGKRRRGCECEREGCARRALLQQLLQGRLRGAAVDSDEAKHVRGPQPLRKAEITIV